MSRSPLLLRLIDDAAVFPPGDAALDVAVHEHLERRVGPYAAQLGPLLVPAGAAAELARLAGDDERCVTSPLEVGLVVRPGAPAAPLADAVSLLRDDPHLVVTGAELGWADGWRAALDLEVPLSVEVGLDTEQERALDDIASAVDDEADVQAKFRTGATLSWAWPDEQVLARFLDGVILRGLAFKLTGGLHHAVRTIEGEPQHGLLNVLLATHEALDGAESDELAGILAQTSAEVLVDRMIRLDADSAARVRASFTAYGCCGVLDPIGELTALGLLDAPA
ncbi:MAG: hypothetical protein ABIS35_15280 [Terracoccus sp.]